MRFVVIGHGESLSEQVFACDRSRRTDCEHRLTLGTRDQFDARIDPIDAIRFQPSSPIERVRDVLIWTNSDVDDRVPLLGVLRTFLRAFLGGLLRLKPVENRRTCAPWTHSERAAYMRSQKSAEMPSKPRSPASAGTRVLN